MTGHIAFYVSVALTLLVLYSVHRIIVSYKVDAARRDERAKAQEDTEWHRYVTGDMGQITEEN